MSKYGRNNQGPTANSLTTAETSNGQPIGLSSYVKGSGKGESPVSMSTNAHFGNTSSGSRANVEVNLFNNATPGAFVDHMAVGVFGVTATQQQNNVLNSSKEKPAHAGWNLRRAGTGSIVHIAYTGTATGYTNTDVGVVSSPEKGGNAAFSYTTNATGGALVITMSNAGYGFLAVNATPNVVVTAANGSSSNGSGATFTAVAGGRAGRVTYETLVAMGSLGAQSAVYGTPAVVSHSNNSNNFFPGS